MQKDVVLGLVWSPDAVERKRLPRRYLPQKKSAPTTSNNAAQGGRESAQLMVGPDNRDRYID